MSAILALGMAIAAIAAPAPPEFDFTRYPVLGAPAYVINLASSTARMERMTARFAEHA